MKIAIRQALVGAAAFAAATQTASAAAEPALVGQWRFDELDGQVATDDGPHRLDGRLGRTDDSAAGDPVRIEAAAGGALRFAGQEFVRLPESDALALQDAATHAS